MKIESDTSAKELEKLYVVDLKAFCSKNNLSTTGKKADFIKRIVKYNKETQFQSEQTDKENIPNNNQKKRNVSKKNDKDVDELTYTFGSFLNIDSSEEKNNQTKKGKKSGVSFIPKEDIHYFDKEAAPANTLQDVIVPRTVYPEKIEKNKKEVKIPTKGNVSIFYDVFRANIEVNEQFDTEIMTVKQLKDACNTNGLSSEGTKKTLKTRLEKYLVSQGIAQEEEEESIAVPAKDLTKRPEWMTWD